MCGFVTCSPGLNGLGSLPHLSLLKGTPVLHLPKIKAKGEKLIQGGEKREEVCVVNPAWKALRLPLPMQCLQGLPLEAVRLACKCRDK